MIRVLIVHHIILNKLYQNVFEDLLMNTRKSSNTEIEIYFIFRRLDKANHLSRVRFTVYYIKLCVLCWALSWIFTNLQIPPYYDRRLWQKYVLCIGSLEFHQLSNTFLILSLCCQQNHYYRIPFPDLAVRGEPAVLLGNPVNYWTETYFFYSTLIKILILTTKIKLIKFK